LKFSNLFIASKFAAQRARSKDAAGPPGKKEARDCLLPGCLCRLGFAGLLLAPCLFFPGWILPAWAASPGRSQVRPPTLRAGKVTRGGASDADIPIGTTSLPVLTTAKAVHSLTHSQAQLHYPVHLRAVCVVCFAGWHGFWVNDGVTGVYVETKNHVPLTNAIHPGIVLDIGGVTGPGEYKPVVDQAILHIVGERPLPPAWDVSLDRLSTGEYDGQWIAFEGTVRSVTPRDGQLSMIVTSGRWQINTVTVPAPPERYERLIGARVRISATGGALLNKRRQAVFLAVYAPSIDSIQVLSPAPADPFSLPLTSITRLVDFAPGTHADDLIRIRGVVTGRWGRSVFIRDDAEGASVTTLEPTSLEPGDLVDAVGYRSLDASSTTLDDAIIKRLGTAPVPEPKLVTAQEASSGDFVDELVRISGRLIEIQHEGDRDTFLVAYGNSVFSAILPDEDKQGLTGLSNAREIQITGVCLIAENKSARDFWDPKAFHILLRSPADVVVISRASWWTTGHTLLLLAFLLAGTLAVLVWVAALRRRVAQQTTLLRESEERFRHMALHDALTGLATRLLLQDRLDVALASARRHGTRLAVLMVDLDGFKGINDTHGHPAGDEVLRVTASRLQDAVRKEDTVSRFGGDEFVVLLPDLSDPPAAERTAARIVESLAFPIRLADRQVPVSVSVGVCTLYGEEELDADDLIRCADTALYRAKANGRNCYVVETPRLAKAVAAETRPQDRKSAAVA
jgi:diguanylate cyclase (GGDEF)-like protein